MAFYYYVPISPSSGEQSNYDRNEKVFYWLTGAVSWRWAFSNPAPSPLPAVRMVVDGVPATDWVTPATNNYLFTFTPTNAHHIANPEIDPVFLGLHTVEVLAKPFIYNSTGSPLAVQAPYTAVNRFERLYPLHPIANVQVPYNATPPGIYPFKTRNVEHYTTLLGPTELWVRHQQANLAAELVRRFVNIPTGDIVIEADQNGFYDQWTSHGNLQAGLETPTLTCRDGPRGVGTLASVYKAVINEDCYNFLDPNGRLSEMDFEGEVRTIAGWRVI